MKYAVISDIHGNLPALKAVLADAEEQGADAYIFGGDYCLSGPYPNECLAVIRSIPGAYIIRGNEEGHLERLIGTDRSKWTDGQMQITYYNCRILSRDNFDYLMALPHRIDIECNGVPIHIAHDKSVFLGKNTCDYFRSSKIATKYAGRTVTKEQLARDIFEMVDGDETFQARLAEMPAGVYIFGHSHVQWYYQSRDRRIITMNPGACGLPLDCIKGTVPYTMLEISENGEVSVDERRVAFDVEAYADTLVRSELYREAHIWTKVILKELIHAREHLAFFLPFTEQYAQSIGDERRPFAVDTWEKAYELWEATL